MTAVFRVGLVRLCARNSAPSTTLLNVQSGLPAALSQKCFISGKSMRGGPRVVKHPPYPYQEKRYNIFSSFFDKTSKRFDENSKIIVVEGPIAAGKTELARQLADELEMCYIPEANMDMFYINSYNYDMRELDPQLPEDCRSFDVTNFCRDPQNQLAAQLQIRMMMLRYEQYIDAIQHVLNTGQGVVLDRCVYSDYVFVEAMHKCGYISNAARSVYYELRENTIPELLQPHLIVYLDVPVDEIKERVKTRSLDYEVNSKIISDKYLRAMETAYKQKYLKEIGLHAEILMYDWTCGGDSEVVIEDIERIDFGEFEKNRHNKKMKDWRLPLEIDWTAKRIKYSNMPLLMNLFNVPAFDVPELVRDGESALRYLEVWNNAPGKKYRHGYNEDMGDTGLWTKTKIGWNQPS